MERQVAKNKTIDILLGDNNPNADINANLFERFDYGENSPVSPITFPNIENSITIEEDVYKDLRKIREKTMISNNEYAFILVGEIKKNGGIYFDTIFTNDNQLSQVSANYDSLMGALREYIDFINNNGSVLKPMICFGHTHKQSNVCDNFSLGDLISTITRTEADPSFRNGISTMSLLLTPSGDYNFIMYDNTYNQENFYKFDTVQAVMKEETRLKTGLYAEDLPAYKNGNYLVDENRIKRNL